MTQKKIGLHRSIQIIYVVDGHMVQLLDDNENVIEATYCTRIADVLVLIKAYLV